MSESDTSEEEIWHYKPLVRIRKKPIGETHCREDQQRGTLNFSTTLSQSATNAWQGKRRKLNFASNSPPAGLLEDSSVEDLPGNPSVLQVPIGHDTINTCAAQSQSSMPSSHSGFQRTAPHQASQHSHGGSHSFKRANVSSGWLHDITAQRHPREQNIRSAEAVPVQPLDNALSKTSVCLQRRSAGRNDWKPSPRNNTNNACDIETLDTSREMSPNATADDSGYLSPSQDASFLSVVRSGGKNSEQKRCSRAFSSTKSNPAMTSSPAAGRRALIPPCQDDQRPQDTITEISESSISNEDCSDEEGFGQSLLKSNSIPLKQHQMKNLQQQLRSAARTGSQLIPNIYGNNETDDLGAAVSYKDSLLLKHTQTQRRNRMLQDITESVYANQSVTNRGKSKPSAPSLGTKRTPFGPHICDDFSDSDDFEQTITPRRIGMRNANIHQAQGAGDQACAGRDCDNTQSPEGSRAPGRVTLNRSRSQRTHRSAWQECTGQSQGSEQATSSAFHENVENQQFSRKNEGDISFDLVVEDETEGAQIYSKACGNWCVGPHARVTQSTQTSPDLKSSNVRRLQRRKQAAPVPLRSPSRTQGRKSKGDSAEKLPFSPILYAAPPAVTAQSRTAPVARGDARRTLPFVFQSDLERFPTRGNLFRTQTNEAVPPATWNGEAAVNCRGNSRMMCALDAANVDLPASGREDDKRRFAVRAEQRAASQRSIKSVRGRNGKPASKNCSDASEILPCAGARMAIKITDLDPKLRRRALRFPAGSNSAGSLSTKEHGVETLAAIPQREHDAGASFPTRAHADQLSGGPRAVEREPQATESRLPQKQLFASTYSRPARSGDETTSPTKRVHDAFAVRSHRPSVSAVGAPSVCEGVVPSGASDTGLSAHSDCARANGHSDHTYNAKDVEDEISVNAHKGQINAGTFYGKKQQHRSDELSGRLSKNVRDQTDDSANQTPAQQPRGQILSRLRAMIERAEDRKKQIRVTSKTSQVVTFPLGRQNRERDQRGRVTLQMGQSVLGEQQTWDTCANSGYAHGGNNITPKGSLWTHYGDPGVHRVSERVPVEEPLENLDFFDNGKNGVSPNDSDEQISRHAESTATTVAGGSAPEIANVTTARGEMSAAGASNEQNVLVGGGCARRARVGGKVIRSAPSRQEVERKLLQSGVSVERMANAGRDIFTKRRKRDTATCVSVTREEASGATSAASGTVEANYTFTRKIPGTNFLVDAFTRESVEICGAYFLSHFHPHAYRGLSRAFDQPIYCSKVTADLANCKLGVQDAHLHRLPLNTVSVVNGVRVVLLDANHCAGASMFLFVVPDGRTILYTGHFRANSAMERNLQLAARRVDICYLDTTCLNLEKEPPAREDVLRFMTRLASSAVTRNARTMIVCGHHALGNEKLFLALAEALGCRAAMSMENYDTVQLLGTGRARDLATMDWHATRLHALAITQLSFKGLSAHWRKFSAHYDYVLAFKPVARSDFTANSRLSDIRPRVTQNVILYGVPFVDHSSRSELKRFVQWLRPRTLVPMTMGTTRRSGATSEGILRKWLSDIGTFPARSAVNFSM